MYWFQKKKRIEKNDSEGKYQIAKRQNIHLCQRLKHNTQILTSDYILLNTVDDLNANYCG